MSTGYGAANYGRFGYGAIPPSGVNAETTMALGSRPYFVNVKPPKPVGELVIITNLANSIITLQPIPDRRRRVIQSQTLRIGPKQQATIELEKYDLGQITSLRKKGLISLERLT